MADRRFNNFSEVGRSGLETWGGVVHADFLRELRGKEAYKRYDEMRLNSPIIGGLLAAIEQRVRGAQWNYVSQQGENDERIALLERARDNMSVSWNDHISEALTMLPFGFALFEIVYERVGSEVLWRKFAIRGQDTIDRWLFDDTGGIAGAVQRAAPSYTEVVLPIQKCVLYRTRVERNNPEGRSILRNAYTSYYYATNIQQIEGIGVERDLAGLPVIVLPQGASTDDDDPNSDANKAAKIVRNIRRDQQDGVVLPFGMTLELLASGGSRQLNTNDIIQRYESRMLVSALAQFLLLGQNSVGTQALSKDQTEFFTAAVNYVADIVAETHTKYAVPRLLALNGMTAEGITLEHTPVGDVDLLTITDALQKAGNKITWTTQDQIWLRGLMGLPEIEPEELEAEQERQRQEQQEMMQQDAPSPFGQRRDDNQIEFYAVDADPPQVMTEWERRARRVWGSFLQGQQERVTKAAKRTRAAI